MKQLIKILILTFLVFCSVNAEEKPALSDGKIIGIYNQVNGFDIESALLAVTRAKSKKVIDFAAQVSNDHRAVRLTASKLANTLNLEVSIPNIRQSAAHAHFQKMAELSKLEGEEFDREYLLHEIDFHAQAISAVETILIPNSVNTHLIKHFETVLPHFKHHLSESIRVAKELGYQ